MPDITHLSVEELKRLQAEAESLIASKKAPAGSILLYKTKGIAPPIPSKIQIKLTETILSLMPKCIGLFLRIKKTERLMIKSENIERA